MALMDRNPHIYKMKSGLISEGWLFLFFFFAL